MIIYINKLKLLEEITKVSRIISQKSLVPALHGILMEVKKDSLILTASDGEITIRSEIKSSKDLVIKSIGSILIKAKYLIEILKKIDDQFVTLEATESVNLKIKTAKFDSSINTLNVVDYPNIVFNLEGRALNFQMDELREIINQTSFAIGINEKRIVFNGLNLKTDINNHELIITATDSFRLACKKLKHLEEQEFDVIIPGKFIMEIGRLLTEQVTLKITEKYVSVIMDNVIIQSKVIEGKYPDTTKVIPTESSTVLSINNRELIKILERASVFSNDFVTTIVTLKLNNHRAIINSNTQEVGNTEEEIIDFEYSGNDQTISFNSRYMLEALRSFNSKKVTLKIINEVKPIVVVSEQQPDLQQLVLPIRSY